jgi:hypothetical protein
MTPTQLGAFWDFIFTGAPSLSFIAPKDGMGENENNSTIVREYYQVLRDVSKRHGKPIWSDVELFKGGFAHPTPPCAYTSIRPAPIARIISQLDLEVGLVDTLTAWEWHAFMSPLAGQCSWYTDARQLYTDYIHYIHNASVV